jgi:signal transduction histidine kinase
LEAELTEWQEKAEQLHELGAPMVSITDHANLLLGQDVGIIGEKQRQFLQQIKANVERMSGLLNDLLNVATIDAGRDSLSPEPVNVVNVICPVQRAQTGGATRYVPRTAGGTRGSR